MDNTQQHSTRTLKDEIARARDLGLHLPVTTVVDLDRDGLDVTEDTDDLPRGATLPSASGALDPGTEVVSNAVVVHELMDRLGDDDQWAGDAGDQLASLAALELVLEPDEASAIRTHVLGRRAGADVSAPEKSSGDEPRSGRTKP